MKPSGRRLRITIEYWVHKDELPARKPATDFDQAVVSTLGRRSFQARQSGSKLMPRVYNFSAGPGTLPEEVLLQAADEMLDWWHGPVRHGDEPPRQEFVSIAEEAEADLRKLVGIPDGYHVLFLQGGASLQFEMIPMNLIQGRSVSDYINTGEWAKKAIKAAKGLADVNVAASAEDRSFTYVPAQSDLAAHRTRGVRPLHGQLDVNGVEFGWTPDVVDVPLVSDMSSNMLSRPLDVRRFGLIYAGPLENIGPARRWPLVIIRDDLIGVGDRHRRCSITRPMARHGRCTTHRRRTRSMLQVWCSNGYWRPAGWPPQNAVSRRRRC